MSLYMTAYNDGLRAAIEWHADRALTAASCGYNLAAQIHNNMAIDLGRLKLSTSHPSEEPTCDDNQPSPQSRAASDPASDPNCPSR